MRSQSCRRLAAPAALAALLVAWGCAPSSVMTVDVAHGALVVRRDRPARWIHTGGATSRGVAWRDGRLVLLGGRRVLLEHGGAVRVERAPAPEPLEQLLLVPSASGPRLVGRSAHGLFRLDDPLGPATTLARSTSATSDASAGPGVVAVWGDDLSTQLLDVETGEPAALRGLVEPRLLHAIAFRSAREGAALAGAELWTTTDGGATFRRAADGVLVPYALAVRDGAVIASLPGKVPAEADVDCAGATVGPARAVAEETTPLLRWIQEFDHHRVEDPLAAAAGGGVVLPDGHALAAGSHASLARVDLDTGVVVELARAHDWRAPPLHASHCTLGRAADLAWLGCEIDERGFMWSLPLAAGPLRLEWATRSEYGVRDFATSPRGGVLFGEQARRPDGGWWTTRSGRGALADGRIAELRVPSPDTPGEKELRIVLTDPATRVEVPLAPLRFYPAERLTGDHPGLGPVTVVGAIEEGMNGALSFVLADHEDFYAVVQWPGREATARRFLYARLHAGHGIGLDGETLFTSSDGGATWDETAAPEGVAATLAKRVAQVQGFNWEGRRGRWPSLREQVIARLALVSEVGLAVGGWVRVGWGAALPIESAPPLSGGTALDDPAPAPTRRLVCTSAGPAPPSPLAAIATRPGPGRHERVELDGLAVLQASAPDPNSPFVKTLTVWWIDRSAGRETVRSATGPAPKDLPWNLRSAWARVSPDGVRAWIRSSRADFQIDAGPGGALAARDPKTEPRWSRGSLGATVTDPQTWIEKTPAGNTLFAWYPGREPVAIASLDLRGASVGLAHRDGVAVHVFARSMEFVRIVPLPLKPSAAAAPLHIGLDGWTDLGAIRRRLASLPACGVDAPLVSEAVSAPLVLALDGAEQPTPHKPAEYDVRIGATTACIAGVTWTAPEEEHGSPYRGALRGLKATLPDGRADGTRADDQGHIERLTCALEVVK